MRGVTELIFIQLIPEHLIRYSYSVWKKSFMLNILRKNTNLCWRILECFLIKEKQDIFDELYSAIQNYITIFGQLFFSEFSMISLVSLKCDDSIQQMDSARDEEQIPRRNCKIQPAVQTIRIATRFYILKFGGCGLIVSNTLFRDHITIFPFSTKEICNTYL